MRYALHLESVPISRAIIDGTASLGGSESACLGLARAFVKRGHDVHLFAAHLEPGCEGRDHAGLMWHHGDSVFETAQVVHWDVFIGLRMPLIFRHPIKARLRILWNQDMLVGDVAKNGTMAVAWNIDHLAYVSAYQKVQWEGLLPDLADRGWVVKNGYDPSIVPERVEKDWKRVIHVSRPERGLDPLLAMWPALKKAVPEAELRICRYRSMYDGEGSQVKANCEAFDALTAKVNAEVGGITWLGSLGKAELYREIAEAAVMWYPGIAGFAETSCIAAIEAQANGTPIVCSWKGALPETAPSAVFVRGDAYTPEYQADSVAAVADLLHACRDKRFSYRQVQRAGREHVKAYTHDAVAAEWDAYILKAFQTRHAAHRPAVLRSFLHEDDHTAAQILAERMLLDELTKGDQADAAQVDSLRTTIQFCEKVNAGRDQSAELYGAFALPDPLIEWDEQPRFHEAAEILQGVTNLIDVACGNGSFAIGFAKTFPEAKVVGVDYSAQNIERAKQGAIEAGCADRCTFYCRAVWDMDAQAPDPAGELDAIVAEHGPFDGAFVGEFLEHVVNAAGLIEMVEGLTVPNAKILYTVPNGPFFELMERGVPVHKGHVHHFEHDDLMAVFKAKGGLHAQYHGLGRTKRGHSVGHWLVSYAAHQGGPAATRDYEHRLMTQRPKATLTAMLIAANAELDLPHCLSSIWPVVDEIVVGNTGSRDDTAAIAERYGARVIDLPPVHQFEDGFSGARNAVLQAATGDWVMWIDADERLMDGQELWQYLDGLSPFLGYMLHQTHVQTDAAPHYDKPVRMFKRVPAIQFYGCVHEQPQFTDCNGDIWPALEVDQPFLAHTGYLTEAQRRTKQIRRNRPLLQRDQVRFPDRLLGKVLWVREFAQMGLDCEQSGDQSKAQHYFGQCIGLFEKHFLDPGHKFHHLVRAYYETAVERVNGAMSFEIGIAGKRGGLPKDARVKTERVWVRKLSDLKVIMDHKYDQVAKQAEGAAPPAVEPVVAWTTPPDGATLAAVAGQAVAVGASA